MTSWRTVPATFLRCIQNTRPPIVSLVCDDDIDIDIVVVDDDDDDDDDPKSLVILKQETTPIQTAIVC